MTHVTPGRIVDAGITDTNNMGAAMAPAAYDTIRHHLDDMQMQPKIKFEIVVSSEEWEKKTIDAIQKAAYTGETGDGKIFSYEIKSALKIRTKETGYDAIQASD